MTITNSPSVGAYDGVILWKPATADSPEGAIKVKDGQAMPVGASGSAAPAAPTTAPANTTPAPASEGTATGTAAPAAGAAATTDGNFPVGAYHAKMKVDFSGTSPMGWAPNSGFYQQGVMTMSDPMGNHRLFAMVAGTFQSDLRDQDIMVGYSNREHPFNWGVSASRSAC